MSAATDLLDAVSARVWTLLGNFADATRAHAVLAGLNPEPGCEGTPLHNRLLAPIEDINVGGVEAAALLRLVRELLPGGGADTLRLHGWSESPAAPRTVALSLRPPNSNDSRIVIALADEGGALGVHVVAVIRQPLNQPATFPVGSGLSMSVTAPTAGTFETWIGPNGVAYRGPATDGAIECSLIRPAIPPVAIGLADGPRLVVGAVVFRTTLTVNQSIGSLSAGVKIADASVDLAPEFLTALLSARLAASLTLDFSADASKGLAVGDTRAPHALVPARPTQSGLDVHGIAIDLGFDGNSPAPLQLCLAVPVYASPEGWPLSLDIDRVGAAFPFRLGADGQFGFDPAQIRPLPITGIGAELRLPPVSGGGAVVDLGNGAFGGAFEVDLGFVAIQAFAVLQAPVDNAPLSFVTLFAVQFPYPGVQLGFGFSLNGVGGLVGLNRGVDPRALEQAVIDGTADALLFPSDAAGRAVAIVRALAQIFPPSGGRFVIGQMMLLAWGGRLVTLAAAIIYDLGDSPQLFIVGRFKMAIPDPEAPLIVFQGTFMSRFDPGVPAMSFTASLQGSHVVGMPLQGDAFALVRGGSDAALILSAGGFHPAYPRPADVPALRRIAMDLSPLPLPRLRAEVYFALTSTSVQFGAAVHLSAEIAECGLEGSFAFDALCRWEPTFYFRAQCSAHVCVEAFGETLVGVSLGLLLEGPAPWHARGTGSISVLFWDASLDFDVSWGEQAPVLSVDPDVEGRLRHAFASPTAWVARLKPSDQSAVVLRSGLDDTALHPLSEIIARQREVPLDVQIGRFQGMPLNSPQEWRIVGGGVSDAAEVPPGEAVFDDFAPGQFFELSESDQLGRPAFEPLPSGHSFLSGTVNKSTPRQSDADFETKLVFDPILPPLRVGRRLGIDAYRVEHTMRSSTQGVDPSWWAGDVATRVRVADVQPLSVATTGELRGVAVDQPAAARSVAAAAQFVTRARAAGRAGLQVVERWEAGG